MTTTTTSTSTTSPNTSCNIINNNNYSTSICNNTNNTADNLNYYIHDNNDNNTISTNNNNSSSGHHLSETVVANGITTNIRASLLDPQIDCDAPYCTSEDSYAEIDENPKLNCSPPHHCQHHHKHNQPILTTSTDDDDDSVVLNTVVDNCCAANYSTINLDDQEIQKYFVNISSNFSRNSSIRRSCRNLGNRKSSNSNSETPTKFGMSSSSSARSRHTTPASSARASPYIFDQFTSTVACLGPSIPTYYSETSCSSRTSTMSSSNRNRSNTGTCNSTRPTGGQHSLDSHTLRKALSSKINIDNATYYQQHQQQSQEHHAGNNGNAKGPESPEAKIKWNFMSDLKRAQAADAERKRNFHRKFHRSAQNINTVSIWCAENDERNAMIFHHETGIVENCSGNYLNFLSSDPPDALPKTKSSDNILGTPLNNTLEGPSKLSGSLVNMQRNVFSQSSSNIYDVSSDYKIFQKQSNLYRNSINLSENYLHSRSSSSSSIHQDCMKNCNNPNLKSSNFHNFSREHSNDRPESSQNHFYCSHDQGLELESYNVTSSNSTENINLTSSNPVRRMMRLHDPIGIRSMLRTIRSRARKYVKSTKKHDNNYY